MRLLWIFTALCLLHYALAANILALLPMPSKSHGILLERLLRKLDNVGHQITYITSTKPLKPLGKTEIVHIPDLKPILMKGNPMTNGSTNLLLLRDMSPWMSLIFMPLMGINLCDYVLEQEPVKKIIHSSQKFDLILGEIFLDESMLAGFANKFNAPIVAIQTFMPGIWSNYMVGNPAPSPYIPDPFLGLSSKMTFLERAVNFVYGLVGEFYYSVFYLAKQDAIMRKHFGDDLPPLHNIIKNTSFVLVNHHHSLGFPRPYVPNMIEIAGVHIDKPNALPKDLEAYMDNSKDGVILFSLGTNVKGTDMPPETTQALLKAFSRLKQNILWKFDGNLPNLPKNVKIMKWLPQSDILAHPNLKLFITHGGLLSTTEAVDRGVPVVGIPIFGDQPLNMKHTENAGLGRTIKFDDITEEKVFSVVSEVISNPKYKEVAQAKSNLLKDNIVEPLESSVWWIEYVLRHKGAPHLRSAAQDLAWYELYLLDVYAVAVVSLLSVAALNFYIARCVFRKLFCTKCSKSKKEDQKKKN